MNKDETTKPKDEKKEEELKQKEKPKEELKKEVQVVPKGTKVDLTKEEKPKEETGAKSPERISSELWEDLFRAVLKDRLIRIERMLEWLIVQRVTDDQKLIKQPNIADIFKEIASKMEAEKKKKEDEVPPTT